MNKIDISPFLDKDHLVAPSPCDPTLSNASGNGVLYTSMYILLLVDNNQFLGDDKVQYFLNMMNCMQTKGGLLYRSPSHPDQEGPDDYIGLAAGAYASKLPYLADLVIKYGNRHLWFFNNECPGTLRHRDGRLNYSALLLRQPQLIALYYYAANRKPWFILRLALAASILFAGHNCPKSDTDARILSYLMIRTVDNRCWLTNLATKIWTKRINKDYPNGISDVMRAAFGGRTPPHPLEQL